MAKEVEFLNQFNFTRSFKNSLELSPENYRKIYKKISDYANFPGFYNSMYKKPTITAFFEVYDNIF
ncbi:hypothetical protein ACIA31_01080 [Lactobacillus delbrueckii subsp. bulgaricus]